MLPVCAYCASDHAPVDWYPKGSWLNEFPQHLTITKQKRNGLGRKYALRDPSPMTYLLELGPSSSCHPPKIAPAAEDQAFNTWANGTFIPCSNQMEGSERKNYRGKTRTVGTQEIHKHLLATQSSSFNPRREKWCRSSNPFSLSSERVVFCYLVFFFLSNESTSRTSRWGCSL